MEQQRQTITEPALLLRPSEAAHQLGIGRTKIYELLRDGSLKSVRIGTAVRVSRKELEQFIERGGVGEP